MVAGTCFSAAAAAFEDTAGFGYSGLAAIVGFYFFGGSTVAAGFCWGAAVLLGVAGLVGAVVGAWATGAVFFNAAAVGAVVAGFVGAVVAGMPLTPYAAFWTPLVAVGAPAGAAELPDLAISTLAGCELLTLF